MRTVLAALVFAALTYWIVRQVPISGILQVLGRLRIYELVLLLLVDAAVVLCITARWWWLVQAEARDVPFFPLIGYRLAAFAVSYLTPGPQIGGEPVQVVVLRSRHGLTLPRAVSTVLLDKLLEFIGNFALIGVGLLAAVRAGIGTGLPAQSASLLVLVAFLALPISYVALLRSRHLPLAGARRILPPKAANARAVRMAVAAEYLASSFTRRHARALGAALVASTAAWIGMAGEYMLMVRYLDLDLNLWEGLSALTASLLAFLIPLPGGVGVLEGSQVLALAAFGVPASQSLALTLLLRARDLVNTVAGLAVGARLGVARS